MFLSTTLLETTTPMQEDSIEEHSEGFKPRTQDKNDPSSCRATTKEITHRDLSIE